MKAGRRRTRFSKLAKIQGHAKTATVRAVNKRTLKRAGLKVLKNNSSKKEASFRPRLAKTGLIEGGNMKAVKKSYGKGKIAARPLKKTSLKWNKIVRIMGHGQFTISKRVLDKLSKVDCAMVQIASSDRPNDNEFKKHLAQLTDIVMKFGKPQNSKEIIKSDIILPTVDLPIDEAKKLFKGEGVIPLT